MTAFEVDGILRDAVVDDLAELRPIVIFPNSCDNHQYMGLRVLVGKLIRRGRQTHRVLVDMSHGDATGN